MLALIAGRGALPAAVAAAQDVAPLVFALEGFAPDNLAVDAHFRIEHLGSFLVKLRALGVTEVCFCGGIDRPQIDPAAIDADTMPLVPVMMQAMGQGDDGALRAVISIFEQTGFTVRAAHDLAPHLLPAPGVPTIASPPDDTAADLAAADAAIAQMGRADLGQACVVRAGQVVAREDDAGTDAMLARLVSGGPAPDSDAGDPITWAMDVAGDALGAAADWLSGDGAPQRVQATGGIMVKAPKPGQDRRADLPTIGPRTAMAAAQAGLDGVVIEAGGVIVLDQPQVIEILDGMGMYLWVRDRAAGS